MAKCNHYVQPYEVGGRKKSLALIIPADVAKNCNITPESLFNIQTDLQSKTVRVSIVTVAEQGKKEVPPANGVRS